MARAAEEAVRHRGSFVRETALIGMLVLVQVVITTGMAHGPSTHRPLDTLAYILLVAGPLGLYLRRVDRAAPLAVTLPVLAVYLLRDYVVGPVFLAFMVSLIIAQFAGRRTAAWSAACLFIVFMSACTLWNLGPVLVFGQFVGMTSAVIVVVVVSEQAKLRRESARQHARARAEESRRVASDERLRLARDLHDVLAHSLSVINVQAGVALHLLDDRDQVESSLRVIRTTSKDTLIEIRDTLNSLRGGDSAPTAPTPSVADVDRLVRAAHDAGVEVDTDIAMAGRKPPPRVDIAAYRIVQEALTNVTKHSAARQAHVGVRFDEDVLVVRISDDGPPRTHDQDRSGSGHGIDGMSERATALGGRLNAGPSAEGGFTVEAHLPVGDPT